MSRQKRALLQAINELDSEIKVARAKKARHEHYFTRFREKNYPFILTLAIPIFLLGWQTGKQLRTKEPGKAIIKYGCLPAFKLLRNFLFKGVGG